MSLLRAAARARAMRPKHRRPFPEDGICPACGANDWRETESGYTRWSSAELEDGVLRVFQDGWDDMSEGGDDHYATCFSCFTQYDLPDEIYYVL